MAWLVPAGILGVALLLAYVFFPPSRRVAGRHTSKDMPTDVPLVLIHGYTGAKLIDGKTGKLVYLNLAQALGLSTPDLRLPLKWTADPVTGRFRQAEDSIRPVDVLKEVEVFGIPVVRTYAHKFSAWAQTLRRPYVEFTYDWRRSGVENSEKFEEFLRTTFAGRPVQVVAHSFGGVITLSTLNRAPELFAAVVFVGVPFGAGLSLLDDLTSAGEHPVGRNRRILDVDVVATFPAAYTFFPVAPGDRTDELIDAATNKSIPVDYGAVSDWQKHRLGLFAQKLEPAAAPEFAQHLQHVLDSARACRKSLLYRDDIKYPPITVVAADNLPTMATVVVGGPQAKVGGFDFASGPRVPGDGRVQYRNAFPAKGIPYQMAKSTLTHAAMLNDVEGLRVVIETQLVALQKQRQ